MYFVYMIECADKSFYTGITTDLERRFNEHKNKTGGSYTSAKKAVRIVYAEEQLDRSAASKREAEIKKWSREKKLQFLAASKKITRAK